MLCLDLYKYFSLLKLVIEPDSLLLEDERSQTSSEEHNETGALPLFFELALVDQHDDNIKRLPMFTDNVNDFRRKVCLKLKAVRTHFTDVTCF